MSRSSPYFVSYDEPNHVTHEDLLKMQQSMKNEIQKLQNKTMKQSAFRSNNVNTDNKKTETLGNYILVILIILLVIQVIQLLVLLIKH